MRPLRILATAALASALAATSGLIASPAAGAPPGPAVASLPVVAVECDAVLTMSVRLAADLTCPADRGITLAADGITLDLDGHTIASPNRWPDDTRALTPGIRVSAHDVTIRDGRVVGWDPGIQVGAQADPGSVPGTATVHGVHFQDNNTGVVSYIGADVTITRSRFVHNGIGADVQADGVMRVDRSVAEDNFIAFSAFGTTAPAALTVRRSVMHAGDHGILCTGAKILVDKSLVAGNATGMQLGPCEGTVRHTAFVANDLHLFLPTAPLPVFTCTYFSGSGRPPGVSVKPCGALHPD